MAIGDITLTAVGNLTGDPEMRFTPQGIAVAAFTIAVNPKEKDQAGKWVDAEPSYVRVQCWRTLAENVCESLTRGTRVVVTGRWREERWEKDGEKHSAWRLTADSVGVDLTFATVTVKKTARRTENPPDDPWANGSRSRPEPAGAAQSGGFSEDPPF